MPACVTETLDFEKFELLANVKSIFTVKGMTT